MSSLSYIHGKLLKTNVAQFTEIIYGYKCIFKINSVWTLIPSCMQLTSPHEHFW